MDEIVERALRRGALWDEVKDRLKTNAFGMSGGQQQRLCIARALAIEPDVILMDEPCSALDPISTGKIEDLMLELRENYSIVIVTHNMQQAARVSDMTAFFTVELDDGREAPHRARGGVRRHREDLHQPDRRAHRGLRHRARSADGARHHQRSSSRRSWSSSRSQALGGLDMVAEALDRAIETVEHQRHRAGEHGDRRRRPHRRPLPRGAPGHPVAARAAGAGGRRPAPRRRAAARDQARGADGRPVREHRQAGAAGRATSRRRTTSCSATSGRMGELARSLVVQCKQAFERRDVGAGGGPGAPGRRDRPAQPRVASTARSRSATTRTRASGRCT